MLSLMKVLADSLPTREDRPGAWEKTLAGLSSGTSAHFFNLAFMN